MRDCEWIGATLGKMDEVTVEFEMKRTWVVTLVARSAARLTRDRMICMVAGPGSTGNVAAVRIRNAIALHDGKPFVSGLAVEAFGIASSPTEAVNTLGAHALSHFQVVAVAANAAIDEPDDLIAFAPPMNGKPGRFVTQRPSDRRAPAATLQAVRADDLMRFMVLLQNHPREDRLQRAIAHYRAALGQRDHINRVMSAESLYMACENLAHVILERLLNKARLTGKDAKHQLAIRNGFHPRRPDSNEHLGDFDSWIRKQHIFEGDDPVYKKLKFASDHFEHGSKDFGQVTRAASFAADKSFTYIRRAILRETGVRPTSRLFHDKLAEPLGDWRPGLDAYGSYTEAVTPPGPSLADMNGEWPQFLGLNLVPQLIGIRDLKNGKRNITLKVDGNGRSLALGQEVKIEKTVWALPGTSKRNVKQVGESSIIVTKGGDA